MDKKSHLIVIAALLLVAVAAIALSIYSTWSSSKKRTTQDVAYNPGTEAADIQFEFRRSSETPWQTALFGLATFDTVDGTPEFRAICWLWSADE